VRADAGPSSTSGGCACSVARATDARGALAISALVLGALVRRRRRR
jgi:MYXO-CTERM domain-containing protein